MNHITLKALAKVNLGLDVLRRREDGYHEVKMIMQTVHLYDTLELIQTEKPGILIQTNLSFLPVNENNLIYKAAKLLMDEFEIEKGLLVKLEKRIPVAAGMAGGSTDAAATLWGVNKLFHLGLSLEELMTRGVKIGADVPYCLMRGTALAEGIGEKLSPLPPMMKVPILIAKPSISVSTKFVYTNLKLTEDTIHPDIDACIQDIQTGSLKQLCSHMGNILETVTIPEYPIIQTIKDKMLEDGAAGALMSGSGPTVFGLFEDEKTAKEAYHKMKESGLAKQVFLTTIYNTKG